MLVAIAAPIIPIDGINIILRPMLITKAIIGKTIVAFGNPLLQKNVFIRDPKDKKNTAGKRKPKTLYVRMNSRP